MPVILITAWGSIALAVEGMKAGAADFVTKPWTNQQMLRSVADRARTRRSRRARPTSGRSTRDELDAQYDFGDLVGDDPRMLRILELVGRVAPTDASVLVTGESGTGKELVAEAIHRNSRRAGRPVRQGEPRRHLRHAVRERDVRPRARRVHRRARRPQGPLRGGRRRHDLPRRDRRARSGVPGQDAARAPGPHVRGARLEPAPRVDVRVVSATNRTLGELVARGEFREDLLYRINLMAIHLPPLRERPDDIPVLASHFLQTAGQVYRPRDARRSRGGAALAAGAALARQRAAAAAIGGARRARQRGRDGWTSRTSPSRWSRRPANRPATRSRRSAR